MRRGLAWLDAGELDALTDYLLESVRRLAGAGCEFAAMAANSPHVVFDALAARSPIPLVSIVDATADALAARGVRRATLLGTRFTMLGRMYPEALARRGVECVAPSADEVERVHAIYVGELLQSRFLDAARPRLSPSRASLRDALRPRSARRPPRAPRR